MDDNQPQKIIQRFWGLDIISNSRTRESLGKSFKQYNRVIFKLVVVNQSA
jgi:hypothetical protein